MASPWIVARPTDSFERQRLASAHDSVIATRTAVIGVRRLVQESWQRSLQLDLDPDNQGAAIDFDEDELHEYRSAHPMALALPTIHGLLIRHTFDAGLIVAIAISTLLTCSRTHWVSLTESSTGVAKTVYAAPGSPDAKITFKPLYENWIGGERVKPVRASTSKTFPR